jgi:hypothetical protein
MEAFIPHPELPLEDREMPEAGPVTESRPAKKAASPRKRRAKPTPETDATSTVASDNDPGQPAIDPAAAAWNHGDEFAEGVLEEEAIAKIRDAKAALRPVAKAFRRYGQAIGRSQESLRQALARSFAWALEMRDRPEVINALLTEKRIKSSKPLRENVFLAAVRLANPGEPLDAQTRWAGALAYGAANGCNAGTIVDFLRGNGIREAADAWTECRRAGKRNADRPKPAKPRPLDLLRFSLIAVPLPADCPAPDGDEGPFLVVAERLPDGGLVAYAALADDRLVTMVTKAVLAAADTDREGSIAA